MHIVDRMLIIFHSFQRKVLESLGHLRIEKIRIKPLEGKAPKAGGKADVEPAIFVPEESSGLSESGEAEYVAVKKLRFDSNTDDDQVIAVGHRNFSGVGERFT